MWFAPGTTAAMTWQHGCRPMANAHRGSASSNCSGAARCLRPAKTHCCNHPCAVPQGCALVQGCSQGMVAGRGVLNACTSARATCRASRWALSAKHQEACNNPPPLRQLQPLPRPTCLLQLLPVTVVSKPQCMPDLCVDLCLQVISSTEDVPSRCCSGWRAAYVHSNSNAEMVDAPDSAACDP